MQRRPANWTTRYVASPEHGALAGVPTGLARDMGRVRHSAASASPIRGYGRGRHSSLGSASNRKPSWMLTSSLQRLVRPLPARRGSQTAGAFGQHAAGARGSVGSSGSMADSCGASTTMPGGSGGCDACVAASNSSWIRSRCGNCFSGTSWHHGKFVRTVLPQGPCPGSSPSVAATAVRVPAPGHIGR